MASILFVSKPVVPPWNDSGKNLVRDLARGLTRHRATLMTRIGAPSEVPNARLANVYAQNSGGFAPGIGDQARVFAHLLTARGHAAFHFFFAPNPRSCKAGWAAMRLRRLPSLHTLSSAPRDARAIVPQLFADVNVVLSQHTEQLLLAAGLGTDRLVRIAPAIAPLAPLDAAQRLAARRLLGLPEQAPLVLYPGDLEFGGGAQLCLEAFRDARLSSARLLLACRSKTPHARAVESELRARVATLGLSQRVQFIGETAHIHALLGCVDVVTLPSTDLYAKMDYPLVLLEAMSLGRAVLVARDTPAAELCVDDAVRSVEAHADALAGALSALLDDESERTLLGQRAERALHARYTHGVMAQHYEAVYDALLR
jgi:phosphatidylinositol alpha-1,6-mannosyltransferase